MIFSHFLRNAMIKVFRRSLPFLFGNFGYRSVLIPFVNIWNEIKTIRWQWAEARGREKYEADAHRIGNGKLCWSD